MSALYDLDEEVLSSWLSLQFPEQPSFRVKQLLEALYRQAKTPSEISNVPPAVLEALSRDFPFALEQISTSSGHDHQGATQKWLLKARDSFQIETVVMEYPDRVTVCASTQAGCAMGCTFCATGQAGFDRHLQPAEIVEQVVRASRFSQSQLHKRLSNVVFMGMGEPLANLGATMSSIETINSRLGIGARSMTISTVGLVPGINQLAKQPLQVGLAVSLHAANDSLRNKLVPINRRYPIAELREACQNYVDVSGRRLSFEWALIDSVNDRYSDAAELATMANPLGAHVNLIPLNPTSGFLTRGSSRNRVMAFKERLERLGVNVTLRDTRGSSFDAACGQLRSRVASEAT